MKGRIINDKQSTLKTFSIILSVKSGKTPVPLQCGDTKYFTPGSKLFINSIFSLKK